MRCADATRRVRDWTARLPTSRVSRGLRSQTRWRQRHVHPALDLPGQQARRIKREGVLGTARAAPRLWLSVANTSAQAPGVDWLVGEIAYAGVASASTAPVRKWPARSSCTGSPELKPTRSGRSACSPAAIAALTSGARGISVHPRSRIWRRPDEGAGGWSVSREQVAPAPGHGRCVTMLRWLGSRDSGLDLSALRSGSQCDHLYCRGQLRATRPSGQHRSDAGPDVIGALERMRLDAQEHVPPLQRAHGSRRARAT